MSTKHTTFHHLNNQPTDYTTWSHEALLARKRELTARLLEYYPMPATETDEDAHIDQVLQQHKHLFTSAAPTDDAQPVDGNELVQDVSQFIARYLQSSEHQLTLLALWVLHTYCFCAARVTPYLAIRSADKQSGKTLCLQLLSLLCDRAALTSGGFTARDLALPMKEKPIAALLFDECQLTLGTRSHPRSPALRAVLAGSFHLGLGHRNIAEERNAFFPKAFASQAALPEELADRCIPIILEPLHPVPSTKACTEAQAEVSSSSSPSSPSIKITERFDPHHVADQIKPLCDRLERWAKNHFSLLTNRTLLPRSAFPPNLSPRQQDLCDPLLQLAAFVAGPWIARALQACAIVFDLQSIFELRPNLQLLTDVRDCFSHHNWPGRLPTELLVEWTDSLPPRPWDTDGPLNAHTIAHLLRPFHIHPRELRMPDNKLRRGYDLKDFQEPWKTYFSAQGSPIANCQMPIAAVPEIANENKGCDTISPAERSVGEPRPAGSALADDTIVHDAGTGPRASESRMTRTERRTPGRIRKVNTCHPERSASKNPPPTTFLSAESKDPENVGSHDADSGSSPQYVGSKNAVHRRTTRTRKKKPAPVMAHQRPPLHETSVHIPMEKEVTVSPARKGDLPNLVKIEAGSQPPKVPASRARGGESAVADDTKKSAASTDEAPLSGVHRGGSSAPAQQPRPDEILPGITCGDVFDDRWLRAFRR